MVTKVTDKVVKTDSLTAGNLAPSSVGSSELQTNAVAAANIQNRVITNLKLALATITSAELADDSVVSDKIADATLLEAHYGPASIPQAALKKPSVGSPELLDASVTAAKMGALSVASAAIQTGAVLAVHIGTGVIADPVIADDAISLSKLKKSATNGSLVYTDASGDKVWKSLAPPAQNSVLAYATSTALPYWSPATVFSGVIFDYVGPTAPAGWVIANGKTIGDASSGGTGRANADCLELFTLLWNNGFTVTPSKGANAAADWAAHRAVALPDLRGRATFGRDGMDGSASLRITTDLITNSKGTDDIGAAGGAGVFKLTAGMLPSHRHFGYQSAIITASTYSVSPTQPAAKAGHYDNTTSYVAAGSLSGGEPTVGPTSYTGGGDSSGIDHQNMPPFLTVTKIIKL